MSGTLTDDRRRQSGRLVHGSRERPSAITGGYGSYTVTSAGVWTYTLDNNNAAVQALNTGASLTDTFTVTTIDGTAQIVTVTIGGANDTAVVPAAMINLTETDVALSTGGTLTIIDVDNPATFVAQANTMGLYGTFTVAADGTWTYVATSAHDEFSAGQSYIDSFIVKSADGVTSSVTIKILGTNDAASISGPSTGAVTEAAGVNDATAGSPADRSRQTDRHQPRQSSQHLRCGNDRNPEHGRLWHLDHDVGRRVGYTLQNSNTAVQGLSAGATLTDNFTVTTSDGTSRS